MKKPYEMTFHLLDNHIDGGTLPVLCVKCKHGAVCTPRRVADVVKAFAENGITVSAEAIAHNWEAWALEEKSGYLDEANGVFVHTPCGCCNDLSFTIFKPVEGDHTYTC